jgi:hypothetical protein
MDVFEFRDRLVSEYERFTRSFVRIRAPDIKSYVEAEYAAGRFWPAPMVQTKADQKDIKNQLKHAQQQLDLTNAYPGRKGERPVK